MFDPQFYIEAGARKLFKNNWEARASLGLSSRTPNFDELYTYFVDVNHNVQGNVNLNPERGLTSFFHVKKRTKFTDAFSLKNTLTLSHINVNDRIELIVINEEPLESQYNNIDEFVSTGISLDNSIYYNNIRFNIGASYFANKKIFDFESGELSPYQGNFQINSNITYTIPSIATSITAYHKYIGETNRFLQVSGSYVNQKIAPYHWLDATVNTSFLDKKIDLTFGVRNILDVGGVGTNDVVTGAHSGTANTENLAYGRSYFIKLGYNLKI